MTDGKGVDYSSISNAFEMPGTRGMEGLFPHPRIDEVEFLADVAAWFERARADGPSLPLRENSLPHYAVAVRSQAEGDTEGLAVDFMALWEQEELTIQRHDASSDIMPPTTLDISGIDF